VKQKSPAESLSSGGETDSLSPAVDLKWVFRITCFYNRVLRFKFFFFIFLSTDLFRPLPPRRIRIAPTPATLSPWKVGPLHEQGRLFFDFFILLFTDSCLQELLCFTVVFSLRRD